MDKQKAIRPWNLSLQWISTRLSTMPEALRIVVLTLLFGMATHGFVYANTLFGHDNILPYASTFSSLRWSAPLFFFSHAYIQMPWVIGLMAMLELGVVNVLLIRLLNIRRLISQILLVITVVTFPSVIAFHNYGFVDLFIGSLLFSILAVYYLTRKGVVNTIIAILLLTVSIGAYQAFICTTMTLLILLMLARLTIQHADIKTIMLDAVKYVIAVCVAVAIYYVVYLIASQLTGGAGVTSYRHEDKIGIFTVTSLLKWLRETYKTIYKYIIGAQLNPLPLWVVTLQLASLVIVAVGALVRLIRNGFFKQPLRVILTFALLLLLPLGMNAIQLLNSGLEPQLLMTFAFIAPWIMVIQYGEWLVDQAETHSKLTSTPIKRVLTMLCAALIGINAFYSYIVANADYVVRKLNYDASISLATRLVDRIESIDGYTLETPVVFSGMLFTNYAMKSREGFELCSGITGSFVGTGQAMTYNDDLGSTIQWFISTILSSNMHFVQQVDLKAYSNLEEVTMLHPYPASDCYAWVDDVLVIKLSD